MKTLLIVTDRTLHTAPRVIRALEALGGHFQIHTVGKTAPLTPVQSHTDSRAIRSSVLAKAMNRLQRDVFGRYIPLIERYPVKRLRLEKLLRRVRPDLVMCHQHEDLPYLVHLKEKFGYKLVFNAHEYYPLEFDDWPGWSETWQPYYEDLYRKCLPHVDLFINVCDSIREKCLEVFGKDSLVIPNAAFFSDLPPQKPKHPIRIMHHGGANPERKIEEMIRLAELLGPDYELTLMLVPNDPNYLNRLKEQAASLSNVHFMNPVSFREIVPTLNRFDIGLYILPPNSFNNAIALPNKIYEFIQAKLAIAIGPSPEMQRLVKHFDLGVVAADFSAESLAAGIRGMNREQLWQFKQNAIFAAGRVSAETYNRQLLQAFQAL